MRKLLFVILVFLVGTSIFAQNKYALVIGNNAYKNGITPLTTAVNDATDVSAALKKLGYEVNLLTNTTIDNLDDAVNKFITKLSNNKSSEGFFWFAGHGVNVENKHYLLAVDVNPKSNDSIIRGSYNVDTLVSRFDKVNNKANLIVLDACRNDFVPGSRSVGGRGLAVVGTDSVVGNQVVYSTMAGSVASDGKPGERNSPFAAAFIKNIGTQISFDNLFIRIVNDTRTLTDGVQRPYKVGYFSVEDYSVAGIAPPQVVSQVPAPTVQSKTASSANTSAGETAADDYIISANAGWFKDTEGGNLDVKKGTEALISFTKEMIQNQAVDVMTLYVNLAKGKVWRIGQFVNSNETVVNKLKTANGIKFFVLGDGAAGWKILLPLSSVTDYCWHEAHFITKKGQIIQVDIPFSKFKQPDWTKNKVDFNKEYIKGIEIQRHAGGDSSISSPSTIKIFNFEIY